MQKKRKKKFKFSWGWFFTYLFMGLLVAFTSLPLIYVISSSLKPLDELFLYPPRFFVRKPTLRNFSELLTSLDSSVVPFSRYLFNSVFTTVVTVFGTVIICSMGAFGLVKYKLPGRKVIFNIIVAALMFSPQVTQIPNYIIVSKLGLIDTYAALIVPRLAVAYNFFLMKQFMEQIQDVYIDAARIDGVSELSLFWKIVMPMAKPAWATLIVFAFVANWNDYFSALVFITSQAMKTMPLALQTIAGGPGQVARTGAVQAAALLTISPSIIIYLFMQSKVMKTMAHSGIKA